VSAADESRMLRWPLPPLVASMAIVHLSNRNPWKVACVRVSETLIPVPTSASGPVSCDTAPCAKENIP